MKQYPSIDKTPSTKYDPNNTFVYVFDKLDGSNIRAEWDRKRGFHRFGTRKRLLLSEDIILGKAQGLIETHSEAFSQIARKYKWESATAFFEFHGPNSFAGQHVETDEHVVTLIDVAPLRKGMLTPNDFIQIFQDSEISIPAVLYSGQAYHQLNNEVFSNKLSGITYEGVVCKYVYSGTTYMFKIKTKLWLDKLKEKTGNNIALFNELV